MDNETRKYYISEIEKLMKVPVHLPLPYYASEAVECLDKIPGHFDWMGNDEKTNG